MNISLSKIKRVFGSKPGGNLKVIALKQKNGWSLTKGTKVVTQGGEELSGVTKITLVCEPDNYWRAVIECVVEPPEKISLSNLHIYTPEIE